MSFERKNFYFIITDLQFNFFSISFIVPGTRKLIDILNLTA